MPKHPMLESVIGWARAQEPIRALVVTGSLARDDGTVDAFSDLDLQVIADDCDAFIRDDGWLDDIGEVWIRFPLNQTVPYRLVWFKGGVKVDFQFIKTSAIREMIKSGDLSDEYMRGYHVALDKDGRYEKLPASPRIIIQGASPSVEEVDAVVNEFFFEALHVAQYIRRREFWVVKFRDWTMKCDLLQMLEWQARATQKPPVDTFTLGKGIRRWSPHYAKLPALFSDWDVKALWEGLLGQIALFEQLQRELRAALDQAHDETEYAEITAYIRALRELDDLDQADSISRSRSVTDDSQS